MSLPRRPGHQEMKAQAVHRLLQEVIDGQGGHQAHRQEIPVAMVLMEVSHQIGTCTVLESVLK